MLFGKQIIITLIILALMAWPGAAWAIDNEQITYGSACTGAKDSADWDTFAECVSSVWVRGPLFIGTSSDTCDTNHAGLVSYDSTQNLLQYCNGSAWSYL